MFSEGVTGLGVEECLDAVGVWHAEQTRLEVRTFVAAAHFADLHHPDTREHREGGELPGTEKAVRLGGAGTPKVLEFAAAVFGPRIGVSAYSAARLMADALDTRHRLPRLWRRVGAGEVPVRNARYVAQQTRELSLDAAGFVDAAVAGYADGRICWSRFEDLVAGKVVAADPERAARLEREAAEAEFAKVGQTNDHGQKTLYVRSSAAAVIRMDASIAFYADILAALGDIDDLDRRRAKAMLILSNPTQAVQLMLAFATHRANSTSANDGDDSGQRGDEPDPDDTLDLDDIDDVDGDSNDNEESDAEGPCESAEAAQADTAGDADADDDGATGSGAQTGENAGPDGAIEAFLQPFRPHEITPDTRFTLGFDPASLLPTVTLYLHLYAADGHDPDQVGDVVRWEGEGPVTTAYVREVLGPHARFTIKPVIDPDGLAPVDAYEVPDRHREAVHLRTPADIFPFAANTTRRKECDHTKPYVPPDHGGPPGQTGLDNLGPMTTFHHRVKTHGGWQVTQPVPGIYLWRDPHGHMYLVDHTGTRPLGRFQADDSVVLPDHAVDASDGPNNGELAVAHHVA